MPVAHRRRGAADEGLMDVSMGGLADPSGPALLQKHVSLCQRASRRKHYLGVPMRTLSTVSSYPPSAP